MNREEIDSLSCSKLRKSEIMKKFVIVGDAQCGKTSLITSFIKTRKINEDQQYPVDLDLCDRRISIDLEELNVVIGSSDRHEKTTSTVFDQYSVDLDGQELLLCDTAGRYAYDRLRHLSYTGTDCFLVCFTVDSYQSLENACDKWTPEILHQSQRNTPYILVGLKSDLRDNECVIEKMQKRREQFVQAEQGVEAARKINAQLYIECSVNNDQAIEDVFRKALKASTVKEKKSYFHLGMDRFKNKLFKHK